MWLKVSEDRRRLVRKDGEPFFWLGDTAWELVHRCSREEIVHYLDVRKSQGFGVVQFVLLAELGGVDRPNAEGNLPLYDLDPARPNEAYFDLVDFALDQMREREMHAVVLPTWGSHAVAKGCHPMQRDRTPLFDPVDTTKARAYAQWLADRYRDRDHVIWCLGGDVDANWTGVRTWQAMGEVLGETPQLVTYHPRGPGHSSRSFHHEPWLDFDMIQSGHSSRHDVAEMIRHDLGLGPQKPTINGEPYYERIPERCNPSKPRSTGREVRVSLYRSVVAGSFGITYGANDVWQMCVPGESSVLGADTHWKHALLYPVAQQCCHLRALFESRPLTGRRDRSELLTQAPDGTVVTGTDRWAIAYLPNDGRVRIEAPGWKRSWFDPRHGLWTDFEGDATSTPGDEDWALVLDAPEID